MIDCKYNEKVEPQQLAVFNRPCMGVKCVCLHPEMKDEKGRGVKVYSKQCQPGCCSLFESKEKE